VVLSDRSSQAFGPPDLCFNAVSFLIDIPRTIGQVYEGIGDLFDEISSFLVTFRIYKRVEQYASIDSELLLNTHRLMISFVDICALSIKLLDGGKRTYIKTGIKAVLFRDDSGVQSALNDFRSLIQNQSAVTEAVTLGHVMSMEKGLGDLLATASVTGKIVGHVSEGMDELVAAESDRKIERMTREYSLAVAKRLSLEPDAHRESEKVLNRMRRESVQNCGVWLQDIPCYKRWIDPASDADPLLLISGNRRSGKSYLVSSIVEELEEAQRDGAKIATKLAIAYTFFERREEKSKKDGGGDHKSVAMALRSMALKLADQHMVYLKELASTRDSKKDSAFKSPSPKELWDALKFSSPRSDVIYVLIFDGLDHLSDPVAEELLQVLAEQGRSSPASSGSAKVERPRLRILATGRPETFKSFPSSPGFDVSLLNTSDIKEFIERELKNDVLLKEQNVEMVEVTKFIRARLPEVARGDYSIVQQKLERIKEAVAADEYSDTIKSILDESPDQDKTKRAAKVISDLNASLKAQDVKQLNEILMWVIYGLEYLSIDQLRTALWLKSRKSPVQPFDKKLKGKYAKVLYVGDNDKVFVRGDVSGFLQDSTSPRAASLVFKDALKPKITMTISINNADRDAVKKFFWDLSERIAFEKYPFDESDAKIEEKGVIGVNMIDSHFDIAEQCLELLNDEPDEKTAVLVPYALENLAAHLRELVDLRNDADGGGLEPGEKKAILKGLLTLLSDIDATEKHWRTGHGLRAYWLENKENVSAIETWLNDPKALDLLEPRDKRSLKRVLEHSEGHGGYWRPLTLAISRQWLQGREWDVKEAFDWIEGFITMVRGHEV